MVIKWFITGKGRVGKNIIIHLNKEINDSLFYSLQTAAVAFPYYFPYTLLLQNMWVLIDGVTAWLCIN